jgi:hypothetical protein
LFRDLATLRTKEPKIRSPDKIRWKGPTHAFVAICKRLEDDQLLNRVKEIDTSLNSEKPGSQNQGQA